MSNKLLCYVGFRDCGCPVQFVSTRDQNEMAKSLAKMLRKGLTVKPTGFDEGEQMVGTVFCDKHKEALNHARD